MKLKVSFVLVAILIGAAMLPFYFVRNSSGGIALQKGEDVYLFLGAGHEGYKTSCLGYAFGRIKDYLRVPTPISDRNFSTLVLHVTPFTVVSHRFDYGKDGASAPDFLTPYGDTFYAMCRGMALCKWTGDGFHNVPEKDKRAFGGVQHLMHTGFHNKIINGWTAQEVGGTVDSGFVINANEKFTIVAKDETAGDPDSHRIKIDLLRQGQAPQTLYEADGRVRRVSKSEYLQYFQKSSSE
jgi:hypothetical protein